MREESFEEQQEDLDPHRREGKGRDGVWRTPAGSRRRACSLPDARPAASSTIS